MAAQRRMNLPGDIDEWTPQECLIRLSALRDIHWPPSAQIMSHLADHPDFEVRLGAIDGLGHVGGRLARKRLLELQSKVRGKPEDELVINSLNCPYVRRKADIPLLLRVIEDDRYTYLGRANAIYGIWVRIEFDANVERLFAKLSPRIAPLLKSKSKFLREMAKAFLAKGGPGDGEWGWPRWPV